jgi:dTDP-4-dehydrorhamnose 3,5-epimerase
MKFRETQLTGAWIIEPELQEDDRGFFARTFCRREFEAHGLSFDFVQCNLSYNHRRGTLRGMHYQTRPHQEAKLVRCVSGALCDVIIDIRHNSPTYKRWIAVELSHDKRTTLYIPAGFAHGYLTLADKTEVFYQMSEFYTPEAERGIRWNDPAFNIQWPMHPKVISSKDCNYPDFIS